MPRIPDNTFDYLISYRTLHHTRVNLSLPEIHRILRPGGVADLSLRNWFLYQDAIKSAGLGNNLILYSLVSELHGVLGEFVSQLKEKYGNIWDLEPEVHETRFELKTHLKISDKFNFLFFNKYFSFLDSHSPEFLFQTRLPSRHKSFAALRNEKWIVVKPKFPLCCLQLSRSVRKLTGVLPAHSMQRRFCKHIFCS